MILNSDLRWSLRAIAILVLLGLAIPPSGVTAWLLEPDAERFRSVILGFWLFKLMLLVNASLFLGIAYLSSRLQPGGALMLRPDDSDSSLTLKSWFLLATVLTVAAGLRLFNLGEGLWFDEIITLVRYARRPFVEVFTLYDSQNQHMLYSLLAQLMVSNVSDSAWSLRFPAAFFGVASLAATFFFGRQVTSNREALLATMLLAFSYHHVWFSQNARGYSGLLFWTLLGSVLWLRLLRGQTKYPGLAMLGYAAIMALGAYTHATAVIVPAAHALIWGLLAWRKRFDTSGFDLWSPLLPIVLSATLTLQLYAIVLPQFLDTLLNPPAPSLEYEWKNPMWMAAEMIRGLARGVPGGLIAVAAGGGVFLLGLVSYARRSPLVAAVMVLPALLLTLTLVLLHHNLWPRMLLFSAGFGALMVIRGIEVGCRVIGPRWHVPAATVTALLLIGASAWTVPRAWGSKQDFTGARDVVTQLAEPGDAVVTVDMATIPFQKYLKLEWPAVHSVAELRRIEMNHRHTYVLYTFPTRLASAKPEIWEYLQMNFHTVESRPGSVSGGAIVIKRSE